MTLTLQHPEIVSNWKRVCAGPIEQACDSPETGANTLNMVVHTGSGFVSQTVESLNAAVDSRVQLLNELSGIKLNDSKEMKDLFAKITYEGTQVHLRDSAFD